MTILPISLLFLSAAFGTLFLALCIFVFELTHHKKKNQTLPSSYPDTRTTNNEIAVLQAQKKAEDIIENAQKEALEILSQARTFNEETIEDADKTLTDVKLSEQEAIENITQDILVTYRQIFETVKEENINTVKSMSKQIESDARREVEQMRLLLASETTHLAEEVKKRIQETYEQTQTDLKAYKEQQLKKIDQETMSILESVAKDILGRAIPMTEHHELLIKALEKAKKEGVFEHATT